MRGISEERLLALGDAQPQGPFERAKAILVVARPDGEADDWLREPIGQVTRTILRARLESIGDLLDCVAACPRCDEPMSIEISVDDLLGHQAAAVPTVEWSNGPNRVEARLPTHDDLAAAAAAPDVARARELLIDRCVVAAEVDGVEVTPAELPDAVTAQIGELLDEADPLTDPVFAVSCPECDFDFEASLDAATYVFGELATRGRRLLYDIDLLAQRYGWSEDQILALPPARRARYLELAG